MIGPRWRWCSCPWPARFWGACLLLASFWLGGCREQRTLTEGDCAVVRERLEEAWNRDAVAAMRLADTDEPLRFVGDEELRIGNSWTLRCRAWVGRPFDKQQLDCLAKVQTIDDVYECAGQ